MGKMRRFGLIGIWMVPVLMVVFLAGSVQGASSDSERVTAFKITVSGILEAQRVMVCSMGVEDICPNDWEVYQVSE
jgi:hypothetical protein